MNLLVTGAWQGFQECQETLKKMGHKIAFLQWEKDPLPVAPEWVEGIIGNGIFLSHPIEQFVNLRYIQLTSAGFDRVPMDYVNTHGITIRNARGVYSIPMAEFVLGGVLQLYKKFSEFGMSQKQHAWEKQRSVRELFGSTVCIVGCGHVGTECAKRFQALGCNVMGVDLFVREDTAYEKIYPLEQLDEIIRQTDILIMTLPLTEETKNLLNRERLLSLKQDAVIANIARGGVMDYEAFINLKQNGERSDLMGVFDVFAEEPLGTESPLWDMDGVIVTPHNSFVGTGNRERLNQVILGNIK